MTPTRPMTVPDAPRLFRAAQRYLERFAASRAMVERVLARRVERAVRAGLIEPEAGAALVTLVADRCAAAGWLNDAAFAEARARALLRRGRGRRAIAEDLGARGIGREAVAAALAALALDTVDVDLAAAVRFAERRRIGPFAIGGAGDPDQRLRALASMARAGFSSEIARRVLDVPDADAARRLNAPADTAPVARS